MTHQDYLNLIQTVTHHDKLYNEHHPEITDSEYDALYFKLTKYETDHPDEIDQSSPTQAVDEQLSSSKRTMDHPYPELSLNKTNVTDGVGKFMKKFKPMSAPLPDNLLQTDEFMVQTKEDGLTIVLYFNYNNQPFTAVTRGGGQTGNIIEQAMSFVPTPPISDQPIIIRGEAIITNDTFNRLNTTGDYMSPRNTVAGLIAKDEPTSDIRFIAYNIENAESLNLFTETAQLAQLQAWGYDTPDIQATFANDASGHKALINYIKDFEQTNQRDQLDHDIDGLVIKPNNLRHRRELKHTAHHPVNQLAYKFASPDAITILRDVQWQVGAKKRVTPVGIFDQVTLLGANITKASLASMGNIHDRDIKIGDHVLVRRANDVIPQIVKSFADQRTGAEIEITPPANAYAKGKFLYVDNSDEELLNRWQTFVSKHGLDFDKLSKQTIQQLVEANLLDVHNFLSLWELKDHRDDLLALPRWGEKKVDNLLTQLSVTKTVSLAQVFYALNLPTVSQSKAEQLALVYQNINRVIDQHPVIDPSLWSEQPYQIHQVPIVLQAIKDHLPEFKQLALHLSIQNTILQQPTKALDPAKPILNIAITGKTEEMTRDELKTYFAQHGAKFANSVTKNTDYLMKLDQNKSNSSKLQKAKHLNVPIITLAYFNEHLAQ